MWRGYTREVYEEVLELFNRGVSVESISKQLNVPEATIYAWLKGVKPIFVPSRRLTDYERGFLEALIDGEGCISLVKYRRKRKTRRHKAEIVWRPRVQISNMNRDLLEKARRMIGSGSICLMKKGNGGRRVWVYTISKLYSLLPQLRLVVKEERRKLLIRAMELIHDHTRHHKQIHNKELEEIHRKMKELNRRFGQGRDMPRFRKGARRYAKAVAEGRVVYGRRPGY